MDRIPQALGNVITVQGPGRIHDEHTDNFLPRQQEAVEAVRSRNAYCSVSLEPPLVLVCVQKTSSTYPALFSSTHLGINVLGAGQRDTVGVFASKAEDKFAELDWHEGPAGSPLIDGSAACLEAEIQERFQAKTHTVFICRVRYAEVENTPPMVYKAGGFYSGEDLSEL